MKSTYICLIFSLVLSLQNLAGKCHVHGKRIPGEISYKTHMVVDIGSTDMTWNELSYFNVPVSYAPRILNSGEMIFNTRRGGVLWGLTATTRQLPFDEKFAHFHAMAKNGTILCSVVEGDGNLSWYLWPATNCHKMAPVKIGCGCDDGGRVFYRDVNSTGMLAGVLEKDCGDSLVYYGAMRCPDGPLNILWPGIAWNISEKGYVYANNSSSRANKPYLWHPKGGFLILSDTGKEPPKECVKYLNGIIAFDDTIYGSYYMQDNPSHYLNFNWEPCYESFDTLGTCGFRVTAVNRCGTMVGSLDGRAMMKERDKPARDLNHLIQNPGGAWFLMEATDINDMGQIVGYGIFNGETHVFLVEPANKAKMTIERVKGCK